MPHLQVLQDKYAKTGKFTVIGSHMQSMSPQVSTFLKSKKVTFPHYEFLNLKDAPCGRGIPHMVLIDHKGKVLKSGRVTDQEIENAIKNAPARNPMCEGVEINHCKREAESLQIGKSVRSTLSSLTQKAKKGGEAGEEAKAIIEAVNKWAEAKKAEAEELRQTAPCKAYSIFEMLGKTFNGLPIAKDIPKTIQTMKRDRYLKYLLSQQGQIDRLKSKKRISDRDKTGISRNLKNFIDNYPASEALKNEAQRMIDELEEM